MIKIDTNKLYALYVSPDKERHLFVAASNEVDKLEKIGLSNTWYVVNDPNDKTLRRHTEEGQFPYYLIREIPYVC